MTGYGLHIFPQHAALLEASAIDPAVARERGYVSVDTKTRLEAAKFAMSQRVVPGLLIPIHGTDGEIRLHQYRPDAPRADSKGREIRYETPWKQQICLDVPPRVQPQLADTAIPLWITEGARKADATVSAGLACISLIGVNGWMRQGTALPDWREVCLKGRQVYITFDSDVMTKPEVSGALKRFTGWLSFRGAKVRHVILPGSENAKVGLDDYLGAGHTVAELTALARKPAASGKQSSGGTPRGGGPEPKPPEPPAEPVDGAALLDDVHAFVGRFVAFPSEAAAAAVTLWAAHTHVASAAESTPRLALLSPEPGSGKTRALEVLDVLAARPMHQLNASVAAIFRTLEKTQRTLLIDECDAIFTRRGKDDTNEDLRALLNAGHRRGATIPRCVGPAFDVREFPVYAPAALAGLGDLPATLMSRSVVIRMKRRAPGQVVEPFRTRTSAAGGAPLAARLATWAAQAAPTLADARPDMPEGVTDRPADVWEPLLAIADAAGGDWPKLARAACAELATVAVTGEASLGVRLLTDLWDIFGTYDERGDERVRTGTETELATATILSRLRAIEEAPWDSFGKPPKPLDARGLASRLHGYGVKSCNLPRTGDGARPKGYLAADLADPWLRYVPESRTAAPPAPPAPPQADDLFSGADTEDGAAPSAPSAPPADPLTSTVTDGADGADLREPRCGRCGAPISHLRHAQAGLLCGRCEAADA